MRVRVTFVDANGQAAETLVTGPVGTSFGTARQSLAGHPAMAGCVFEAGYVGRLRLDDRVRLGDPPLVDGTIVSARSRGDDAPLLRAFGQSSTSADAHPDNGFAAVRPDGAGHLLVNRAPRRQLPRPKGTVTFPDRPTPVPSPRLPLLSAALPLAFSLFIAWMQHSAVYLLFGLMTPALVIGNVVSDRFGGRRAKRAGERRWRADRDEAERRLADALAVEAVWRRAMAPDPEALLRAVALPTTRLWERAPQQDDYLSLRVGIGGSPAAVQMNGPRDARPEDVRLADVPVTVALPAVGVLGISGADDSVRGVARWLIGQVAGWHSPRDVRLVLLAADDAALEDWRWTELLPHARPEHEHEPHARFGSLAVPGQVQRRVAELETVLARHPVASGTRRAAVPGPTYVVVLAGAARLRGVAGVARLLQNGPGIGILAICLDGTGADLPYECGAVVELPSAIDGRAGAALVAADGHRSPFAPDDVSSRWCDQLARCLAPLRDATPSTGRAVPDRIRLLPLVRASGTDPDELAAQWLATGGSTLAVIGVTVDGVWRIDLRQDGPHVLVGGTTGSGKSELLQTLIASLALANSPEQMSFVLVDYKGGAAFAACAELPHTLGLVTDLDEHLAARALTSLRAELTRRERILAAAGVADIDDYRAGPVDAGRPLGRLVLVIDEFRMLAEELPSFLDGVVRIAALGRSLGVHLVLATQRPAGVVSADIAANVNLRIALRVRDQRDSEDVIGSGEAAELSPATPGRGFARTGTGPPVLFQAARVSASSDDESHGATHIERLTARTFGEIPGTMPSANPEGSTDLQRIVATTTLAAVRIGTRRPHRPWLPPLPDTVTVEELSAPQSSWLVPYGVIDRPEQQQQHTVAWDLADEAHLVVAGSLRSGRTSTLRTLAGVIARRFTPDQVHVYAVDGGSGGLSAISALPHAGVVTPAGDPRALRLLDRLGDEVERRRNRLGADGFGSLAEQHRYVDPQDRLPYLVLLVDGWESATSQWEGIDHGRPTEVLQSLLRDGASVGLRAVVTGDRGLLVSRVGTLVRDKIVLQLADPADRMLAGLPASSLPHRQPPGRGVRTVDHAEVQLAVLAASADGHAQTTALHTIGRTAPPRPARGGAFRIEPLPDAVQLTELPSTGQAAGAVVVGLCGDEARPAVLGLSGTTAVIAGPPRSGRTTTLSTVARALVGQQEAVVVVSGGCHPQRGWPSTVHPVPGDDANRLQAVLAAGTTPYVLVDDVDDIADTETEEVLLRWVKARPPGEGGLVVAGDSDRLASAFRGLSVVARRSGRGVLLSPRLGDGDLLGVRLTPVDLGARRPGRGALVVDRTVVPLQVAM